MTATISPASTVKLTPRNAPIVTSPRRYSFETSVSSITDNLSGGAPPRLSAVRPNDAAASAGPRESLELLRL